MHFQRLRLSGFKSFVDTTEFRIEPGLTGVVGPNGCGKSNLLEALRWVMGATSAKAMRGEGMDDVIFGGTGARPSRNHAEVLLQIDNAEGTAPAQFNTHPVLEVVRRIDRGSGSSYKVNGVEARARDVQLLFADASTGANSPSLVRQGQISELVAAKPANRRRILEEAAGVSGLYGRRHEADLRLNAAQVNLTRLSDVASELESGLNRLKREARQAERYRRLAAEIRALQGAALYARWREAEDSLNDAVRRLGEAEREVERTTREAARASAESVHAQSALPPLRDEAAVAAAVHQHLVLERDRVEREAVRVKSEVERLKAERARLMTDEIDERRVGEDAEATLERLTAEREALEAASAAAPSRTPALEHALAAAQEARAAADREVERLAAETAADAARRQAAVAAHKEAQDRLAAAVRRREAAQTRIKRLQDAQGQIAAERLSLSTTPGPQNEAEVALRQAEAALAEARSAAEAAEAERMASLREEGEARSTYRRLDDAARRLQSEADGLRRLQSGATKSAHAPVLDLVRPEAGYEAALAAALGEDLDAALDTASARHWRGAEVKQPPWPQGAAPLSAHVAVPQALAARLSMTALVAAADGERLQKQAPVGARLVSMAGDLWRWDGYTVRADAPKPAALRLAQRARLESLDGQIVAMRPELEAAGAVLAAAERRVKAADEASRTARARPSGAERVLAAARERCEALDREAARREARRQALGESEGRLRLDLAEALADGAAIEEEAQAAEIAARAASASPSSPDAAADAAKALAQARAAAAAARESETRARNALDQELRARDGRARRLQSLEQDRQDWRKRAAAASARLAVFERRRGASEAALQAAEAAPAEMDARIQRLLSDFASAEARRSAALDRLGAAETAAETADRNLRASERAASEARERRAAALARHGGAVEQAEAMAQTVRRTAQEEPEALGARLRSEAVAIPTNADGVEAHVLALERERDALGSVNLRAEEEALEATRRLEAMGAERQDLLGAVTRLRTGIEALNQEGRERLQAAFTAINASFKTLFETLFQGGQAELRLVESPDPLEAGLEIFACPPGKRLAAMSLMSGGEQALTATALIFAVFLSNPSPVCVLDEVDAPLDDANVDRFCRLLDEMRRRTQTRFIVITHHPVTMSRMDRLYGVTMAERGVSQLVSVDLRQAEALAAE